MPVVDDYLKNLEPPFREELARIKAIILDNAPDAEQVMTYGMPGFKYKKKYLIAFGVFKDHMSLFPGADAVATLREKIPSHVTSKGTIQFTIEQPLGDDIIKEIVLHRVHEIDHKV